MFRISVISVLSLLDLTVRLQPAGPVWYLGPCSLPLNPS